MSNPIVFEGGAITIEVTEKKLSIEVISQRVEDPGAGAIATFTGVTRDIFNGKEVLKLEYEAYKLMAEKKIREICDKALGTWDIKKIAISHRTGEVLVGQPSVVIAVSSAHRKAALEACAWAIDDLKATVPIWKKEFFVGGEVWKENAESRAAATSGSPK